ncbi:MAG: rod shape-determining protein RodA [Planctomycetes bacterium]|nr:rod shape-determining protein RodA [Planctomycetota bacterium]
MTSARRFEVPWLVALLALGLLAIGILFVQSSTLGTDFEGLERRQLLMAAAGLLALVFFASFSHRQLARFAFPLYGIGLLMLVLVPFVGVDVGGARRWFALPGRVQLQPSELMKPFLVLALARWFEFRGVPDRLRDLMAPLLLVGFPFLLIKFEPDLGTALLLAPIAIAMTWCAGARKLHFLGGVALAAVLVPAIYFSPLLKDYQKERVTTFLESVPDLAEKALAARRDGRTAAAEQFEERLRELKLGAGYQSHCAQMSIGSGGRDGKGLGLGPNNRLSYLPARHTDFIFAVIAEEWGFVGASGVVLLFLLLGTAIVSVGVGTRDRFSQLVAVGAAASLGMQAFANVAMTTGLMPVTGIPLPLVSQGGSSLLSTCVLLGCVFSVARSRRDTEPFLYRVEVAVDPFHARSVATPARDSGVSAATPEEPIVHTVRR